MTVLLWIVAGLVGCDGTSTTNPSTARPVQVVDLTVQDVSTPDGSEPAFVGPNGVGATTLFTVAAGQKVKVVVKDEETSRTVTHLFASTSLGLFATVNTDTTTTFSFTPDNPGTYTWNCEAPCGNWVMGTVGYMEGEIRVVRT